MTFTQTIAAFAVDSVLPVPVMAILWVASNIAFALYWRVSHGRWPDMYEWVSSIALTTVIAACLVFLPFFGGVN